MSIRISLDDPPEFYTNLDLVKGRIIIGLTRYEQVGAIIVKLEGESNTALMPPPPENPRDRSAREVQHESHKILYKVAQVFPDETTTPMAGPLTLAPGQHQFTFNFKLPFNNACSDPVAMARIGGVAGPGGYASGPGLLGLGGIRVMDGTKQLQYSHVKQTLPPSFTGFPRQAEVRYFIKVTVQRPGLFKENWRYQIGFKFLPIEPPRPPRKGQEAYARRPFTFRPRSPRPLYQERKRSSFFTGRRSSGYVNGNAGTSSPGSAGGRLTPGDTPDAALPPPSIEMSARLPHPSILTCNAPIPLRLIATNLNASREEVYLISLEIDLIGDTVIRASDLQNNESTRWVIASRHGLAIPVSGPDLAMGSEKVIPDVLWKDMPLPNTVMPSFVTCNLRRSYHLEIKVGLSWGKPGAPSSSSVFSKNRLDVQNGTIAQELHLPLHFSAVEVYSGLAPPAQLVAAMQQNRPGRPGQSQPPMQALRPQTTRPPTVPAQRPPTGPAGRHQARPPALPGRTSAMQVQQQPPDALYPPQLQEGDIPPYDDAPPSYDEAMADNAGPVFPSGAPRPAYSGVTNENGPSMISEKR